VWDLADTEGEDSFFHVTVFGLVIASKEYKREATVHHSLNGKFFADKKGQVENGSFAQGSGGWSAAET